MEPIVITTEADLAATAAALGADQVGEITAGETALANAGAVPGHRQLRALRDAIGDGLDPLGDVFTNLRTAAARRPVGATYTPPEIVTSMIDWAADHGNPTRVIDAGAGSGRFTLAAAKRFPKAQLVGVEIDPLAAIVMRGNVAAAGHAKRTRVILDDFRALRPGYLDGQTLWTGNPPYVRHHQIAPDWKDWLTRTAAKSGHRASQLAGLHVHFFLATVAAASPDDYGCYITAAEWMDTNYGSLVRQLLLDGLGGTSVHVLDPKSTPFKGTATTGAISTFHVGVQASSLRLRRVETVADLGRLDTGRSVKRQRLLEAPRWTPLLRAAPKVPEGYIELGEICRVHRGAVTGANRVWVTRAATTDLPASVLLPSVTKARELFAAGEELGSAETLRRVIDLPVDLDELGDARCSVEKWLLWAKNHGAADGYVARNRRAWWSVGLRDAAPILATYMARRAPAFVRNLADARHINIAHGLYPREALPIQALDRLAEALRGSVTVAGGRTYAGGLTKFEPREMERLPVPSPEVLLAP